MTKLMIIPNKKDIKSLLKINNCFLIGLNNYSINFETTFSLDEIKELSKQNIELFVAVNKNLHTDELEDVKKILYELEKINIKGLLYYDVSIVKMVNEENLNIPLVWSQEHLTTNYGTINFWKDFAVNSTYLSPDITLQEIIEIRKNTTAKLIVPIFGYLPMFVSERHIVDNYINYFKLNGKKEINYLQKEDKKYPIVDEKVGTTVYANNILNGYQEYLELDKMNIDYVTMNQFGIDINTFKKIINIFKEKKDNQEIIINELLNNQTSKHFLHKETIYRVKNHE